MNADQLRHDFDLPEEDSEHLDARGLPWETISEGGKMWLFIRAFPTPLGYNVSLATIAIQIPANYPTTPLDMVYFNPALSRTDGVILPNTEFIEHILGLPFQRWSRHRSQENPWRPGVDNISSQLSLAEEWLYQEFIKRPGRAC